MDVTGKFAGISLGLHKDGFVAPLEEMPAFFMLEVEIDRVRRVDELHDPGEVPAAGFEEQVVMIGHEAESMDNAIKAPMRFIKAFQEVIPVGILKKDNRFLVPSRIDMIESPLELDP